MLGVALLVMAGACKDEEVAKAPEQSTAPVAPPPVSAIDVASDHKSSAPPVALPPGVYPSAASVQSVAVEPPNATGSLESLVSRGNIYFFDDDGNFLAKDGVDFLQRAIRCYQNTNKYKSDDTADWPPMTDLQLLVQYKVIKVIPAAPAGQKFVLDPQTRTVSLASN